MPMVAIVAFINGKFFGKMMVIFGNARGRFGLFASLIANLMNLANPTAFWLVNTVI